MEAVSQDIEARIRALEVKEGRRDERLDMMASKLEALQWLQHKILLAVAGGAVSMAVAGVSAVVALVLFIL